MLFRVLWYCYELSRNQWLKPSELKKLQEKRLRAVIRHAYENVPLYHKKFESAGIKPTDVRGVEDLKKAPFTTKQEVRNGIPDLSIARGYDLGDCVRMSTSGTTGGPMPVFYDKRFWDYVLAEAFTRKVRAMGLNPWDKTMLVSYSVPEPVVHNSEVGRSDESKRKSRGRTALGPSFSLFRRWRKNAFIAYSADEIIQDIVEYQPKILKGNASYLRLVAETMVDRGIEDVHPKALVSWGEVLDDPTRDFLEASFKCPVFNSYGINEAGWSIAAECKKKEGLHITSDFLILEVVRDGEPVGPFEQGEIVVTGLLNYAMPLIRYRVGDVGVLDDGQCSCGRSFPLLKSVEGRVVDCLSLPDGRSASPKTVMTAVQATPGVSRYRVVQESRNKVDIELMNRENDPEVSTDDLLLQLRDVLGDDVEIEVFVSDRKNLKAKFRPVISKLKVSSEPRWTQPRG